MDKEPPPPPKVKKAIEDSVLTLQHASICREANCRMLPTCTTMKRIIEHSKICCRIGKTDCLACRALVSLSYDHAKGCLEFRCAVPYCNIIKMQLMRCRLYEVNPYILGEFPVAVFAKFNRTRRQPRPHVHQPQRQASADPNQALQQAFEELQLPPLRASREFNQPPQQASPDLNYPPQQAAPLYFMLPQQSIGGRRPLQRRVCYRTVTHAEQPPAASDGDAPIAAAGLGIVLNAGLGPVPRRIRVKKSTFLWITTMLFGC